MSEIITQNATKFQTKLTRQMLGKEKSKLVSKLRYAGLDNQAMRSDFCGTKLMFERYAKGEITKLKLTSANFCQSKFCVFCAFLKARKLANQMKSVLEQIEDQRKVSYIFLTLTIKNPPLTELRDTLKKMSEAFNNLTKEEVFQKAIKGYIRAFEFLGDSTKEGEAHPHIHAVLVVSKGYFKGKKYIKQEEWAKLWQKHLKVDYLPQVNVQKIKSKNDEWKDSDSAIFETIKYCVSPVSLTNLSEEDFAVLYNQTKGIRQYNKGGLMKSIKPLPREEENLEGWEIVAKEIWKWSKGKYEIETSNQIDKLFFGKDISSVETHIDPITGEVKIDKITTKKEEKDFWDAIRKNQPTQEEYAFVKI